MSTFNEADHPRHGDGKWATKELDEVDPGFGDASVDASQTLSRGLAEQLEKERLRAEETGEDPLDEDAPWSWTAMAEGTGDRWLSDLYERADGSLGMAAALLNEDTSRYGFGMSRSQVAALKRGDLMPSDVDSPDRDLRMAARAARGDLVFEGELLSEAYRLDRHATTRAARVALSGRVMARPRQVLMPGENGELAPTNWSSLTAEQQLGYLDGYTAVMQGRSEPGGELPTGTFIDRGLACNELRANEGEMWGDPGFRAARLAGVNRAHATCNFQHEVTSGIFPRGAGVYIARGQMGNEMEIRHPIVSIPGSKTQFQGTNPANGGTVIFHVDEYLGDVAF